MEERGEGERREEGGRERGKEGGHLSSQAGYSGTHHTGLPQPV